MENHFFTIEESSPLQSEFMLNNSLSYSQETEEEPISSSENDIQEEPPIELNPSVESYDGIDGEKEITPVVGMKFNSHDEAKDFYNHYALQKGFGTKVKSSWTRKNAKNTKEKYHALFACVKEGFKVSKETASYKRPTFRIGCKAHMRIKLLTSKKWKVTSVEFDHNHDCSPSQSQRYRSHKRLESGTKRRLELNSDAGIRVNQSFHSLVVDAGGYQNLKFGEREARNHVDEYKRLKLEEGDAQAMHLYFTRMQQRNSNFFYLMDLDDEGRVRNVFWADSRSRTAYEYFGDVVTFDTTYLTNKYDLKFAPFVGVNHHGQSVLLGCALLADETIKTFIWVFQTWLTCMSGCPPNAIITDQCQAMHVAIAEVFPRARHRLCLWHIMKKISDKLGRLSEYKSIKRTMKNAVYESIKVDEFETAWTNMIQGYGLLHNEWLTTLYNLRQQWIPAFLKNTFFAGMSTTQRSESMNAFFDEYVHAKTTLKEFVEKYDLALHDKYEKETQADFDSWFTDPSLKTSCCFEAHAANVYTRAMFIKFQDEVYGMACCSKSLIKNDGVVMTYYVKERIVSKSGEKLEPKLFEVLFKESDLEVNCICRLFEFKGILCKHALCVLNEFADEIPSRYILSRWRKDFKRKYISELGSKNVDVKNPVQRYDFLYKQAIQVVDEGVISEVIYNVALKGLQDLKKLLQNAKSCEDSNEVHDDTVEPPNITGCIKVLDPLQSKKVGRPREKRLKASSETNIAKKMKNGESTPKVQNDVSTRKVQNGGSSTRKVRNVKDPKLSKTASTTHRASTTQESMSGSIHIMENFHSTELRVDQNITPATAPQFGTHGLAQTMHRMEIFDPIELTIGLPFHNSYP